MATCAAPSVPTVRAKNPQLCPSRVGISSISQNPLILLIKSLRLQHTMCCFPITLACIAVESQLRIFCADSTQVAGGHLRCGTLSALMGLRQWMLYVDLGFFYLYFELSRGMRTQTLSRNVMVSYSVFMRIVGNVLCNIVYNYTCKLLSIKLFF